MTTLQVIFLLMLLILALPIIAYMVMKFGAAGYFRAKQRQQDKTINNYERQRKEASLHERP